MIPFLYVDVPVSFIKLPVLDCRSLEMSRLDNVQVFSIAEILWVYKKYASDLDETG